MSAHRHKLMSGKLQDESCWCDNPTAKLILVRCTGCNYRYEALEDSHNVGYNHDHDNRVTGGTAVIERDCVIEQSTCLCCGEVVYLSKHGDWFHEDGYQKCSVKAPVAKPDQLMRKEIG